MISAVWPKQRRRCRPIAIERRSDRMGRFRGILALVSTLLLAGTAYGNTAQAETSLFDPGNYTAWVDLRLSQTDGERGWLDGGFGKLRHGNETAADIAQAAILWKPQLT